MKLLQLLEMNYFLDGGTYEARFATFSGQDYNLWLKAHLGPHEYRHRQLFEYYGTERPKFCRPLISGGIQEQQLVQRVRDFLSLPNPAVATQFISKPKALLRLEKMLECIQAREPCHCDEPILTWFSKLPSISSEEQWIAEHFPHGHLDERRDGSSLG